MNYRRGRRWRQSSELLPAGFLIYTYVLTDAFQFRLRFKT